MLVAPGGDYGFAWIKHGTNAKDLEYFVEYLGFTPMEAWFPTSPACMIATSCSRS